MPELITSGPAYNRKKSDPDYTAGAALFTHLVAVINDIGINGVDSCGFMSETSRRTVRWPRRPQVTIDSLYNVGSRMRSRICTKINDLDLCIEVV